MKTSKLINYIFGMIAGIGMFYSSVMFQLDDTKRFFLGILLFTIGTIVVWINDEEKN